MPTQEQLTDMYSKISEMRRYAINYRLDAYVQGQLSDVLHALWWAMGRNPQLLELMLEPDMLAELEAALPVELEQMSMEV